jgi:endonuclease/exonuclease/phosphatase (EEP) superfamily protein YafD
MEIFGPNNNRLLTLTISLLLVAGMAISIFTPNFLVFNWWSKFIMQITVGYWIVGLGFLILKQQRLTMIAFACCVVLCLYLKGTTNSRLEPVKVTNEPKFSIAHFNLSESSNDYNEVISAIKQTNADIISLQEVTPDWNPVLKDSFSKIYPYSCQVGGFDLHSSKILQIQIQLLRYIL